VKIHIGHCKGKNPAIYEEYNKNCVIEESFITVCKHIPIDLNNEELENSNIVNLVSKVQIENSIGNDVATQITKKAEVIEIQNITTSVSGSGNNTVY
jgi:hypothetical protein